jgi:hypothetical protein
MLPIEELSSSQQRRWLCAEELGDSRVRSPSCDTSRSSSRRDENDPSTDTVRIVLRLALLEVRESVGDYRDQAEVVDVEERFVLVQSAGEGSGGAERTESSGVENESVETTESLHGNVDGRLRREEPYFSEAESACEIRAVAPCCHYQQPRRL